MYFWIFKITFWISQIVHFGYLKWKLWLITIGLKISEMGVFPSKNSIADIQNVHSRYAECNCGYLKLKAQYTWMAKVMSIVLGSMSLWISEMFFLTRKNWIYRYLQYISSLAFKFKKTAWHSIRRKHHSPHVISHAGAVRSTTLERLWCVQHQTYDNLQKQAITEYNSTQQTSQQYTNGVGFLTAKVAKSKLQ